MRDAPAALAQFRLEGLQLLSCSFGSASVTSAAELANRNAPPILFNTRQTISSVPPPANPAPSDASAKPST